MVVQGIGNLIAPNAISSEYAVKRASKALKSLKGDVFVKSPSVLPKNGYLSNPLLGQYSPRLLLNALLNEKYVNALVEKTPSVKKILVEAGVENPVICVDNVKNIANSHIKTTTDYAMKIAKKMNLSAAQRQTLEQAAIFHDFGKVMVPREILEKPEALNAAERKIIDTHARVGQELLNTAGFNKRVTDLVGSHHDVTENDVLCNILSVADIYSALKETRPYKSALSDGEAFKILDQNVKSGKVSPEVVAALKDAMMSACA